MRILWWGIVSLNLIIGLIVIIKKHRPIGYLQILFTLFIVIATLSFCSYKDEYAYGGDNIDFIIQCVVEGHTYAKILLILYFLSVVLTTLNVCRLYTSVDEKR